MSFDRNARVGEIFDLAIGLKSGGSAVTTGSAIDMQGCDKVTFIIQFNGKTGVTKSEIDVLQGKTATGTPKACVPMLKAIAEDSDGERKEFSASSAGRFTFTDHISTNDAVVAIDVLAADLDPDYRYVKIRNQAAGVATPIQAIALRNTFRSPDIAE